MNNLVELWRRLSIGRRIVLAAATVGVFLAVLLVARIGQTGPQSLLYAGLDPRAAGEVVNALDQLGAPYAIRGDSIYVPTSDRDALRMQLAGQGLPASGGAGYELLDGLTGFGTTSQMFDAAYLRAKEGELARTILAMPGIRAARVHLAQSALGPFADRNLSSASVTVTTQTGGLTANQADALRHLLASAAGNMAVADVAVIDSVSGLVPLADPEELGAAGASRSAEIKRNIERLLAARVGQDRAIVEVAIDLVRERETISERLIDPETRVAISSDTEQDSESATDPGDTVSVASNLPDGDAAASGSGQSQSSRNRERLNFEISETQRELLKEPGAIRRLTVAVLVDGERVADANGALVWQPRSEAELADLRELVASAAGLDESRGDVLTLKSLEFQQTPTLGTEAEAGFFPRLGPIDTMSVIQLAAIIIVVTVLSIFVLRPMIQLRTAAPGPPEPAQSAALLPPHEGMSQAALTGEISDAREGSLPAYPRQLTEEAHGASSAEAVSRLKRLIDERQAESVEILRGWLDHQEERS